MSIDIGQNVDYKMLEPFFVSDFWKLVRYAQIRGWSVSVVWEGVGTCRESVISLKRNDFSMNVCFYEIDPTIQLRQALRELGLIPFEN